MTWVVKKWARTRMSRMRPSDSPRDCEDLPVAFADVRRRYGHNTMRRNLQPIPRYARSYEGACNVRVRSQTVKQSSKPAFPTWARSSHRPPGCPQNLAISSTASSKLDYADKVGLFSGIFRETKATMTRWYAADRTTTSCVHACDFRLSCKST